MDYIKDFIWIAVFVRSRLVAVLVAVFVVECVLGLTCYGFAHVQRPVYS